MRTVDPEDLAIDPGLLRLRGRVRIAAAARDDAVVAEAAASRACRRTPERAGERRRREFALEISIRAGGLVRVEPRLRFVVGLHVAQDEIDVGGIAGLPGQRSAHGVVVVAAPVRNAGDDGFHPPVILVADERDTALQVVAQGTRDRTVNDDLVETADREVGVAFVFAGRSLRDELDCATRGIAPEQCSLRTAERLDARQVEYRKTGEVDRARVTVILVDRDRRLLLVAVIVLRYAADVEHDLRRRVRIHLEAGYGTHDIRGRRDVEILQRLLAERRHRDADVLYVLLAALGRHHDLGEGHGSRRGLRLLSQSGRRLAGDERRAGGQLEDGTNSALCLPHGSPFESGICGSSASTCC